MSLATPLQWPLGRPRTPNRKRAQFKVAPAQARKELYEELERLGATKVVITTNAELRLDGQLAVRQPWNLDPAIAVYFTRKGQELCLACDRWDDVGDNIRAVGLSVAAIRSLERWGTSDMVDAAFSGFAALPAGTSGAAWWDVLGLYDSTVSRHLIELSYRALAKQHHPDAGGDPELWHAIQLAYEQAMAAKGGA